MFPFRNQDCIDCVTQSPGPVRGSFDKSHMHGIARHVSGRWIEIKPRKIAHGRGRASVPQLCHQSRDERVWPVAHAVNHRFDPAGRLRADARIATQYSRDRAGGDFRFAGNAFHGEGGSWSSGWSRGRVRHDNSFPASSPAGCKPRLLHFMKTCKALRKRRRYCAGPAAIVLPVSKNNHPGCNSKLCHRRNLSSFSSLVPDERER